MRVFAGLAAICIVAVILVSVALFLLSAPSIAPACSCPIGVGFTVGDPIAETCPPAATFAGAGCSAGDFVYSVTIESSIVNFGDVRFHVETAAGSVYVATGGEPGFSVLTPSGMVAAQYSASSGEMSMGTGWAYTTGIDSSTALSYLDHVLVDMGTVSPQGQGYVLVAVNSGSQPGLGALALP